MKLIFFIFCFFFLQFNVVSQQTSLKEKYNSINNIMQDVKFLSSDELEGRATGTNGEKKAAEYIYNKMSNLGLKVFLQEFDVVFHGQKTNLKGTNVIGYLDNNADNVIIIGAHYDHLGYGEFGSRAPNSKEIHNGADDNASGVALILELAKKLKKDNIKSNIIFIAFSGEELGLLGSDYFASNIKEFCTQELMDTVWCKYMLNFDMVGKLKNNKLTINGVGTSSWSSLIKEILLQEHKRNKKTLNITEISSGIGPSDYTAFYKQKIPVLSFFTGAHNDYHTPKDDFDRLNYYGIYEILLFARSIIKEADNVNMYFTKTKEENSRESPRFSVTLGVMPSYSFDGKGMKIDVVIDNRPASKSGIKNGDIVVKIGSHKVDDLNSYMKALGKFKKGDTATVVVLRSNKTKSFQVVF